MFIYKFVSKFVFCSISSFSHQKACYTSFVARPLVRECDFLLRAPSFSKAHYTQLPYQQCSV